MTEGILNETEQPIAAEDTTTIQQESLVPFPVVNTVDNQKPEHILSFGEKAVGIKFNPSEYNQVDSLKRLFANCIDMMDLYRKDAESPEAKRMLSIAITEAQTAKMWAVSAVTWEY